jgi:lysozyme family protein
VLRSDPGNWTGGKVGVGELRGTKYGIAASSHPTLNIQALTEAEARAIYGREYWSPSGCDLLPAGVDLSVFDPSVNSGVSRGKAYAKATGNMDVKPRITAIAAKRTSFYRGLSTFKTFGKGWLARVARCEAASLKMAMAAAGLAPPVIQAELVKEAKAADAQVKKGQAGAVAAGGGAAGLPAAADSATSWGLVIVGIGICLILILIAIHFIRAKQERGHALLVEAAATGGEA